MPTTKPRAVEKKPVFDPARCKHCGICAHFCPFNAIAQKKDGTPYLAKPEACTSCGLCQDMCPDWAIRLAAASVGGADGDASGSRVQKEDEQA